MDRVALVTGANRGIGLEICKQLAQQNINVILTGRDEERCRQAKLTAGNPGGNITYQVMDVTSERSIQKARNFIKEQFGRLDILINNAGVYLDDGVSIFDLPLSTMKETLEVNLIGAFLVSQTFVPLMKTANYGRVVNISSGYGGLHDMSGKTAAYRISKTGLNALTKILAAETAGYQIKVNSACPGWNKALMGGSGAPRSVEQAVETIIWLATLNDQGPNAGFYREKRLIPW